MEMRSSIKRNLESNYRAALKDILHKLPELNISIFKRMYSHLDINRPIDDIVDSIASDKLEWALTQCENTLKDVEDPKDKVYES